MIMALCSSEILNEILNEIPTQEFLSSRQSFMFKRLIPHNLIYSNREHKSMFMWNGGYRCWVLNLHSMKGLVARLGRSNAFMFCEGEPEQELRASTMLEF